MAHLTNNPYINKDNMLIFLDKLAEKLMDRYRNTVGTIKILIVGGSALALKYNFRATVDIDTDIKFNHSLKGSIDNVAKYYNIPTDWINQDFCKSNSYSRKLWDNAIPVSVLRGFMEIYIVCDLDQLCMKVASGRPKDRKDIVFLTVKTMQSGFNYDSFVDRYKYLYLDRVTPNKSALGIVKNMFASSVYMRTQMFRYGIRL